MTDLVDHNVVRMLRWFERKKDVFVGEANLTNISLAELQTLFERPTRDQMYDSYKVEEKHVELLQQKVASRIDLSRYDYFVEADAIEHPNL